MAVYKATHCYPMLNNVDSRIVADADNLQPVEFLKCQIDTSNKDITGYSIRILDSLNNQIFPVNNADPTISPVSELADLETNEDFVNTGLNGSFLHVPFFQNKNSISSSYGGGKILSSYNAIYYEATFKAHYILTDVSGWTYTTNVLTNTSWDGSIDDEKAQVGDVILTKSTDSNKGGLWSVKEDGTLGRYYINGVALTYANVQNKGVLILRGSTNHNKVYTVNSSWSTSSNNKWEDVSGNVITDWGNEGQTFKWEITLYQGEGVETTASEPYSISYTNLDTTWYDMVLQTGTICGTTPKRLQLGSTDDSSFNAKIPAGTESDPLVLQGRWAQLLDDENNKIGARAYIKSYDASYGHAYPNSDAFSVSDIGSASKVEFYKYSNSVDYIEASDIVNCATTENINNLYGCTETISGTFTCYYTGGNAPVSGTSGTKIIDSYVPQLNDTVFCPLSIPLPTVYKVTDISKSSTQSITSIEYTLQSSFEYSATEYYFISKGDVYGESTYRGGTIVNYPLPSVKTIDEVSLTEGMLILVKNQSSSKENGVYVYHSGARWTRSGSYDSWGDFIGKIIFVENGENNGGKNFESLANAGGTLYTGTSASSGDSPLYFTLEKPITLFSQDVYRNDIDLAAQTSVPSTCPSTIDGVPVKIGMLVYYSGTGSYGTIYKVISETAGASSWVTSVEVLTASKLLYVNQGQVYGHAVVQRSSSTSIVEVTSLSKAYLMKNSSTRTYISPFIGLKKGMALKLQNNKKASFTTGNSEWIKLNLLMNKNTWCVQHAALSSVLKSYDEQDSDVPWTYEVRSFYRSSDESIFYCYETPYLKLGYNGTPYSDIVNWQTYGVISGSEYQDYATVESASSYLDYLVKAPSLTAIVDRFATLQGYYHQFQQLSWVSYRWVLTNQAGDILQDTGKKFDKKMEASFYGLSNEEGSNIYYVILYVEDALKESLELVVKLIVVAENMYSLGLPFHATFEKQTHSIVLEYDDYGQILPSITNAGNTEVAYILDNDEYISGWDNSISYDDANLVVTENDNKTDAPVINRYSSDNQETANVSLTVQKGVGYSHYFPSDETIIDSTTRQLKMYNEEFSLQTEIQLDDDYNGDFLTIDLVDENNSDHYVRAVLYTPWMWDSISTMNDKAYCIMTRLEAVDNGIVKGSVQSSPLKDPTGSNTNYKWSTADASSTTEGTYYALVPTTLVDDVKEAVESSSEVRGFSYTIKNTYRYPWYLPTSNGKIRSTQGATTPLGNLCLLSALDIIGTSASSIDDVATYSINSLPYWAERRQKTGFVKVKSPLSGEQFVTMTTESGTLVEESSSYLSWPSSSESGYIWIEQTGNEILGTAPDTWQEVIDGEEIGTDEQGLKYYSAMPRHYNMLSKQKWKININAQNISTLYTLLSGGSSTLSFSKITGATGASVQLKDSSAVYYKVMLTPEEVE